MKTSKTAKVTLVGAGPGAKDLITLRGLKAIQSADVILYDALVSDELLSEIDDAIIKIYVGKRCGLHSFTQQEINVLIVENAFKYGHVVRLKGGDPLVFGRANEEIGYVESFGIIVEVVPGISSVIAVPGSQGIPMTQRGVSSSFWVMTATKKEGSFSEDLKFAAQSETTMVILMGIRKFKEIITEVSRYRSALTPFAIIQNGTMKNEAFAVGCIGDISGVIKNMDVSEPGIIVIGDVVSEHPSFFEEEVQRVLYSSL
ncbi:uroporphyrinogen-III C-methyltransferase [Olleya sp. HaHaR_3_96]|uniref:uroporphyrinogen-III C-methyltransferase n=1 Tax=Olleya sp. HaHaR_3_96 TaxID=2745560 RepID=UPI001C4E6EE4|nr:uroporphyrinogen-III C-methyltransferase [Olleya sp. HaHaR_3_96]QXP59379.1 uroporphyrinogen-III C-methyltransferase [Olleya sp. HaHaR_3_96]